MTPPSFRPGFLAVATAVFCVTLLPVAAMAGILWGSPRLVTDLVYRPTARPVANQVVKVSLGSEHTLYLTQDLTLWAAGRNSSGQVGGPNVAPFNLYRGIGRGIANDVVDMAAVDNLSVYLKSDGTLWFCGSNPANGIAIYTPVQIGSNVASFAVANSKVFYVRTDGVMYGWGNHVGNGSTVVNNVIPIAGGVASVSASWGHALFVGTDGTLWAVGRNTYGQLGNGNTATQLTPVQVVEANNVVKVVATSENSYYLKSDGTVWAMGLNDAGQLGDGFTINRASPVQVLIADVVSLEASGGSAYFLKADASLWAVGRNDSGQLGTSTTSDLSTPVPIAADVAKIYAGRRHALYLKSDGTLWAMGNNQYGQLGDGTTISRTVPVMIAEHVGAGATSYYGHSAYITNGSKVWTMGRNQAGQLADGIILPDYTLIATDVVSASMGYDFGLWARSDGKLWLSALGQNSEISGTVVAVDVGEFDTGFAYMKSDGTLWELAWEGTSTQLASDVSTFGLIGNSVAYITNDGSLWGKTRPGSEPSATINFGTDDPVQLAASGVSNLSTALSHLLFTKTDHTLWGVGSPLGGWGSGTTTGQYASSAVQLQTGVLAGYASLISQLYLTTDGNLWDQGFGWNSGSPGFMDSNVAQAAAGQLENYYIKTDGALWRDGVHIGDNVTSVSAGSESGAMFIQTAGLGIPPQITGHPESAIATSGDNVVLEVAATGGLPLHYQWFKDGIALPAARSQFLSLGYLTPTDAGSYTVAVVNSAGSVSSNAATLVVKEAPEIVWPSPAAITFGTALGGVQLNASSNVAGSFVYAPVAGTILDAGNRVLTGTFTPADTGTYGTVEVKVALTVNKASATVTLADLSAIYDGSAHAASATTDPVGMAVTVTYDGSANAPTAAGSYAVVATINDANYAGSVTGTLTIARATQIAPAINSAASFMLGGGYTATVSGSGFGALEWSLGADSIASGAAIDASTGAVSATSIGTVKIKVRYAGDANHNASPYTTDFTVTVDPVATTFALSATNFTYSGGAQGPSVNATPSSATFASGGVLSATNVGNYTGTATAHGNYTGTNNALNWTIAKANQAAPTINSAAVFALGSTYTGTATGSGFGDLEWALGANSTAVGSAIHPSTGAVTATSVGLVRIKVRFAGDANHNASVFSPDFSVVVIGSVAGPAITEGVDFNGDGRDDIFWSNTETGERAQWQMDGTVLTAGAIVGMVPVEWVISATGEFNGDGKGDLFWTNTTTGDRAAWLMNGSSIASNAYLGVVPVEWQISGTGDFNGDGRDDILWSNITTGDRAMWFMNGGAYAGGGYLTMVPVEWQVRGTGDYNGDGKADILWSNANTGERAMWLMDGTVLASGAVIGTVPVEWVISASGDYNADGKGDLIWTNTTTGDRAAWLMDGPTIQDNAYLSQVPVEWQVSGAGDYNGDGKDDVLWTNTITGDRAMWFMNGGSVLGGGYLTNVPLVWEIR